MVKLFEALLHPYRVPGVGKVLRQLDPLNAKLDKTVSDSLDYDFRQGKDKFSGFKRGGQVKRFAKGGSSDDNEVESNLPAVSNTRKGPSKRLGPAKVRSENRAKVGNDDLTPRSNLPKEQYKYAKGGTVRGDGCCKTGKTKGRFR